MDLEQFPDWDCCRFYFFTDFLSFEEVFRVFEGNVDGNGEYIVVGIVIVDFRFLIVEVTDNEQTKKSKNL